MAEQSEENHGSPWRSVFCWRLGLLILVPLIAYSTAIAGGYVWLDHTEIEEAGYRITSLDDFGKVWAMTLDDYQLREQGETRTQGGYWRPVYAISISIDWWLWGNNPHLSHFVNILLHIAVVILLYFLALDILPNKDWKQDAAFFAAVIFAVLPINASSVTWVSGRKDLLAPLFALIAMRIAFWFSSRWSTFQFDEPERVASKKLSRLIYFQAASVLFVSMAVLSKELAFILPAVFLVTLYFVRKLDSYELFELNDWIAFWVISVTVGAFWLIRRSVTGAMQLSGERPGDSPIEEMLTLSVLWWRHLIAVVWPFDPLLSDRISVFTSSSAIGWLAVIGILLVVAACVMILVRRWKIGYGLIWYILWTLPTSGILTLRHWYAERYLYPASWGIVLFAVVGCFLLAERIQQLQKQRLLYRRIVGGLTIVVLAGFTIIENRTWWDDETLFTNAVQRDPQYLEGHAALAERALQKKQYEETIQHSKVIIESDDDPSIVSFWSRPIVHSNLGLAYFYTERMDEARQQFLIARKLQPNQSAIHYHLGLVAIAQKQRNAAESYFRKALELNPDDHLARGNLAFALLSSGNLAKLKESMEVLKPIINESATALDLRNHGSAALALREWDSAKSSFVILMNRNDANAADIAKLAWAEFQLNNRQEASRLLDQAFQMDAKNPVVLSYSRLMQH